MADPNPPIPLTPRNNKPIIGNVIVFTFEVPSDTDNDKLVFKLQIDTVNTFDSGNLKENESRFSTDQKTNGKWEVHNGSNFIIMPTGGVGSTYYGNDARVTIREQDTTNYPWTNTTWYWRILAADNLNAPALYNQVIFGQAVYNAT